MKKRLNYGFPLFHILFRILFLLVIVLILFTFIIFNIYLYIIFLVSFFAIISYVFFGIIQFKKCFIKKRMYLLKKILKIANIKGDEIVLDLGTGSGFLAIGFAKNLQNGKSFGLDKFSLKNDNLKKQIISLIKINFFGNTLKNANINAKIENVENKCEFIQTDITNPLNFSDEFFNIIVSSQFFYCIPYQKRLPIYQEIDRVLKKDGMIIFFESKSVFGWNLNEIKKFFELKGYEIFIIPVEEFKKCCILIGQKNN